MTCNEPEEKILDYLDGSLPEAEKARIAAHIATCAQCKVMLEQTVQLQEMMGNLPMEAPPAALKTAFEQLLQEEQQTGPAKPQRRFSIAWKPVMQAAAAVLLLVMGYWLGTVTLGHKADERISRLEAQTEALKTEMTLAMLDNRSASKRIQAVNYSEEIQQPDAAVLQAIIGRLHYDENVNVRLAAAEALWKFKQDTLVQDALIHSLETETNPDVQIAVISMLVETKDKRAVAPMQKLLREPDVPAYVKEQLSSGLTQIL